MVGIWIIAQGGHGELPNLGHLFKVLLRSPCLVLSSPVLLENVIWFSFIKIVTHLFFFNSILFLLPLATAAAALESCIVFRQADGRPPGSWFKFVNLLLLVWCPWINSEVSVSINWQRFKSKYNRSIDICQWNRTAFSLVLFSARKAGVDLGVFKCSEFFLLLRAKEDQNEEVLGWNGRRIMIDWSLKVGMRSSKWGYRFHVAFASNLNGAAHLQWQTLKRWRCAN